MSPVFYALNRKIQPMLKVLRNYRQTCATEKGPTRTSQPNQQQGVAAEKLPFCVARQTTFIRVILLDDFFACTCICNCTYMYLQPIPYVDLGASMCCAGLSLQQKRSPLPLCGATGTCRAGKERSLLLGYLLHRSVGKTDNVDAWLEFVQFLASNGVDADNLVRY